MCPFFPPLVCMKIQSTNKVSAKKKTSESWQRRVVENCHFSDLPKGHPPKKPYFQDFGGILEVSWLAFLGEMLKKHKTKKKHHVFFFRDKNAVVGCFRMVGSVGSKRCHRIDIKKSDTYWQSMHKLTFRDISNIYTCKFPTHFFIWYFSMVRVNVGKCSMSWVFGCQYIDIYVFYIYMYIYICIFQYWVRFMDDGSFFGAKILQNNSSEGSLCQHPMWKMPLHICTWNSKANRFLMVVSIRWFKSLPKKWLFACMYLICILKTPKCFAVGETAWRYRERFVKKQYDENPDNHWWFSPFYLL